MEARLIPAWRVAATASLALLATGLIWASSAAAAPAWLTPVNLAEGAALTGSPHISVDSRGDAAATWFQSGLGEPEIEVAMRAAAGTWQTPVTISEGGESFGPSVALGPQSEAVVAWVTHEGEWENVVNASVRSAATGGWSAPLQIGEAGGWPGNVQVAMDAQGNTIAVWETLLHSTGSSSIEAAVRPAGGSWSVPIDISTTKEGARFPRIVVGPEGNATVTWWGVEHIQSATRVAASGVWEAPVDVEQADLHSGARLGGPPLAVDAKGNVVAEWSSRASGESTTIVQAAGMEKGGSWQTPVQLSESALEAGNPNVAFDAAGDAIAAWGATNGGSSQTQVAIRPAGGVWQAPVTISEPGQVALSNEAGPQVAATPRGEIVVVWERYDGTHRIIQSAVRAANGTWQTPVDLSATTTRADEPKVAVDPLGDVVSAWQASDLASSGKDGIQTDTYDAAGPLLDDLSIPTSGVAGQPVVLSVSPLDAWSLMGQTSWSLGDGATQAGTSVTHTYAAAGSYRITLTSKDALGNDTSASATIAITPAAGPASPSGIAEVARSARVGTVRPWSSSPAPVRAPARDLWSSWPTSRNGRPPRTVGGITDARTCSASSSARRISRSPRAGTRPCACA